MHATMLIGGGKSDANGWPFYPQDLGIGGLGMDFWGFWGYRIRMSTSSSIFSSHDAAVAGQQMTDY
jgi:hypothetical protein